MQNVEIKTHFLSSLYYRKTATMKNCFFITIENEEIPKSISQKKKLQKKKTNPTALFRLAKNKMPKFDFSVMLPIPHSLQISVTNKAKEGMQFMEDG